MERGKKHGGRQQPNDRLQESANQGLFCEAGKDRNSSSICDRPSPHHVALPGLQIGKGRHPAQYPEDTCTHHARDKTRKDRRETRAPRSERCEKALRTERQTDQSDDSDDAFLMDQDDRRDRSGRRFFVWTHWVMTAGSVSGFFFRRIVCAVNSLLDIKVLIIVLDRLGPRDRHDAVPLVEAYDTHTLGGATEA